MKKEEMKEIVKEAVLEALMQFTTGAVASEDGPAVIEPGDDEDPPKVKDDEGDDDKKKEPLDPGPLIGPAGF